MNSVKRLFVPFDNMDDCCVAILIKKKFEYLGCHRYYQMIRQYFNISSKDIEFDSFFSRVFSLSFLFPSEYINCFKIIEEKIIKVNNNDKIPINFYTSEFQCYSCKNKFEDDVIKVNYAAQAYMYSKSSEACVISSIECTKCGAIHYPSYVILKNKKRFYYENFLEHDYVAFSDETMIEALLLKSVTTDLVFKHSSFFGFCGAYNSLFKHYESDLERSMLIDKRLTEYWFYYNLIIFEKETHHHLRDFEGNFIQDLDSAIERIKTNLFNYFVKKWSSHQNLCKHPQCSIAINIDGNHKVNRLTCMFDQAFDQKELKSK